MERLQGPINPCFLEEEEGHLSVEMEYLLEQETSCNKQMGFGSYGQLERSSNDSSSFEEIKIPFLEMLQSGPSFSPFSELGGFQALLCLQQQQQQFKELPESCLTHDAAALEIQISPVKSDTVVDPHLHCTHSPTVVACNHHDDRSKPVELEEQTAALKGQKKRKRVKRTRPAPKNKEEMESQRMTHIAVERNRRRQMNDHLTALRSLMPSSYIQRGDQASIIGGAIDYVKELEQLHQSLQAQKRMKKSELFDQPGGGRGGDTTSTSTSSSSSSSATTTVFLATSSPTTSQCGNVKSEFGELGRSMTEGTNIRRSYEFTAEKKSGAVEVHVTVIQNHVNLKVVCPRMAGQLLKAIVGLEELGLTVLHLNIMALENSAHYSFNLKIEEGCEIGSADGIAAVVHQMFSFINGTT